MGQEAARVRKLAALRGWLCAEVTCTHLAARPAMAVPGAFLAPILLLLFGLGPYLADARSTPGKGHMGTGWAGGRSAPWVVRLGDVTSW